MGLGGDLTDPMIRPKHRFKELHANECELPFGLLKSPLGRERDFKRPLSCPGECKHGPP